MKIILAPDKFKGTLSAPEITTIIAEELRKQIPDAEILSIPLADGGEGTVEALTAASHGKKKTLAVHGPLGKITQASFGVSGKTFFMEMASASGMALLKKEELNPMKASTAGTGELILHALDSGAEEIILGIGGSATCDGGAGMAEILGCRFYDKAGKQITGLCGGKLKDIEKIDSSAMDSRLNRCRIRIASDVRNPLLGTLGAVNVFAPQKGASPEMLPILEAGMKNFSERTGIAPDCPGDGAAGGLGYGLRVFCSGKMESGANLVMDSSGFLKALKDADLVITGEGCTDSQTEAGKVCSCVASVCHQNCIPCILLSGSIRTARTELLKNFDGVFVTGIGRDSLEEYLSHAAEDLRGAARSLSSLLAVSRENEK